MKQVFGIDFGTTSSAVVSLIEDNEFVGNPINYGIGRDGIPLPSIVAINRKTGEVITGLEVKEKRAELSSLYEVIYSIKTYLDDETPRSIAGKKWYPKDVAAELFKSLRRIVKDRQKEADMSEAVVAIPVGFSAKKRRILRESAEMAGIKITSFVSEPTAAFFSNYDALNPFSTIAVFDWGGGTLDVSILKNENGNIYEISKSGRSIAGDFIDRKIAKYIHSKFSIEKDIALRFEDMGPSVQDELRTTCENAKIQLSTKEIISIIVLNYGSYGTINYDMDCKTLSDIINPEINMAMECLYEAIEQAGIGKVNIDRLLLVGGSSKLRSLRERMNSEFGEKVFIPENPEWDIGKGASRLALQNTKNFSNQSVGIDISDGSYFEFLHKDENLDGWSKTFKFAITDSSEYAQFVFDGSPEIRALQSRFRTLEVPSYGFLQEKIEVKTSVNEDLVFTVEAKSDRKGNDNKMTWEYENLKCYYKL